MEIILYFWILNFFPLFQIVFLISPTVLRFFHLSRNGGTFSSAVYRLKLFPFLDKSVIKSLCRERVVLRNRLIDCKQRLVQGDYSTLAEICLPRVST